MLRLFLCVLCCCGLVNQMASAQDDGFKLEKGISKLEIPFELVSNNILINVEVNGQSLNFILDTGASRSIVFDFKGVDSLNVVQGKKLKYQGYGEKDYFEAYQSDANSIKINDSFFNENASLLILLNYGFSISDKIGLPVHGLLGNSFFKNHRIKIDNEYSKLIVFSNESRLPRRIRKSKMIDLEFIDEKPHITSFVINDGSQEVLSVLDTGSSDALFLFQLDTLSFKNPKKGFRDYLGYGMSGDIYGKRSKIEELKLFGNSIKEVTVSIPEEQYLSNNKLSTNNYTSIGMEVMRRFNLTFDYPRNRLYVEPLSNIDDGFFYNMTGIDLRTDQFEVRQLLNRALDNLTPKNKGRTLTARLPSTTIVNTPRYFVRNIRKNSVAQFEDVRIGDQIIEANGYDFEDLSFQKLADLFHTKPYSTLKLTILRDGVELKKELKLVPLIE